MFQMNQNVVIAKSDFAPHAPSTNNIKSFNLGTLIIVIGIRNNNLNSFFDVTQSKFDNRNSLNSLLSGLEYVCPFLMTQHTIPLYSIPYLSTVRYLYTVITTSDGKNPKQLANR